VYIVFILGFGEVTTPSKYIIHSKVTRPLKTYC